MKTGGLQVKKSNAIIKSGIKPMMVQEKAMSQFPFIKAPDPEYNFDVGDTVEVNCDHEKNGQRIRGWLKGIVVQVDAKMVAVQFRTNVFLTDGWMVPDHILWFPQNSNNLRLPQRRSSRSPGSKTE
jgi:hypothetical protein